MDVPHSSSVSSLSDTSRILAREETRFYAACNEKDWTKLVREVTAVYGVALVASASKLRQPRTSNNSYLSEGMYDDEKQVINSLFFQDRSGWTALHVAAFHNAPCYAVDSLISLSKVVDTKYHLKLPITLLPNHFCSTPLHFACEYTTDLRTIKHFISECPLSLLLKDVRGNTPLGKLDFGARRSPSYRDSYFFTRDLILQKTRSLEKLLSNSIDEVDTNNDGKQILDLISSYNDHVCDANPIVKLTLDDRVSHSPPSSTDVNFFSSCKPLSEQQYSHGLQCLHNIFYKSFNPFMQVAENQFTVKLAINQMKKSGKYDFVVTCNGPNINKLSKEEFVFKVVDMCVACEMHALAEYIVSLTGRTL